MKETMKREQRDVYLNLTRELDGGCLCSFCKYALWSGGCDDAEVECNHSIESVWEDKEFPYPGMDCWGFRPKYSLPVIADIVGIIIGNHWESWSYWEDCNEIRVGGFPARKELQHSEVSK
jgi:hypothetical protein